MATEVPTTTTNRPKPRGDAYTGMLIISLIALLLGSLFVWLDMSRYPKGEPPKVQAAPTAPAK